MLTTTAIALHHTTFVFSTNILYVCMYVYIMHNGAKINQALVNYRNVPNDRKQHNYDMLNE